MGDESALSYMEEQRKQGEAGIRVLKRRLDELHTKIDHRKDFLQGEMTMGDRWYAPDVPLEGASKPTAKASKAKRSAGAGRSRPPRRSAAPRRGSVVGQQAGGERPSEGGRRRKARGVQSPTERLRLILNSYEPRSPVPSDALGGLPPSARDLDELPADKREHLLKAKHEHVLKHSLSAQLLRRNPELSLRRSSILSHKKDTRRSSIASMNLPKAGKSKGAQTPSSAESMFSFKPARRNLQFKSSLLRGEVSGDKGRGRLRSSHTTGNHTGGRAVEDIQHSLELEEQFQEEMNLVEILSDTFQRARIMGPGVSSHTLPIFLRLFLTDCVQDLCLDLFWYTFCRYFSRETEDKKDYLVERISRSYTRLSQRAMVVFPPNPNRKAVRDEKDSFLGSLPYLLAEAMYVLFHMVFPASALYFEGTFRDRLDLDLNLLLGGVRLCSTTQAKQKVSMFGDRAFAWNRRKARPVNRAERRSQNEYSDYSDASSDDPEEGTQSRNALPHAGGHAGDSKADQEQMPLQEELDLEEADTTNRKRNKRLRPRKVKFNTNLMSPVLQRGLERWTALPTWRSQRMISHSMPLDDSLLGGENTWVAYLNRERRDHQDRIIEDCQAVRDTPECRSDGHADRKVRGPDMYKMDDLRIALDERQGKESSASIAYQGDDGQVTKQETPATGLPPAAGRPDRAFANSTRRASATKGMHLEAPIS